MTIQNVIKLQGKLWEIISDEEQVMRLHRYGINAKFFKVTKNLVWRNKLNGQFMSRKITKF